MDMLLWFGVWFGSCITVWQKRSLRGSTKWSSAPTWPGRGPGVRRNKRAEDPLLLSTDPSPFHWTLKLAVVIAPTAPLRAARFSATKIWGASRRRPRGGRKDRARANWQMNQVQKYDDDDEMIRKIRFCKHPELIEIFLHKCWCSVNMVPTRSFMFLCLYLLSIS